MNDPHLLQRHADRWERLRAMVRAGHVDFVTLDDPHLLQREHQRDRMEYERDEGPHNETFYIRGQ